MVIATVLSTFTHAKSKRATHVIATVLGTLTHAKPETATHARRIPQKPQPKMLEPRERAFTRRRFPPPTCQSVVREAFHTFHSF